MRKQIVYSTVIASLFALAGVASAQNYVAGGAAIHSGYVPGGYGGYGGYHSSTIEEGSFRGLADFTRAIGEADYMSSLAGINRQEAWNRAIDNRKKSVDTY